MHLTHKGAAKDVLNTVLFMHRRVSHPLAIPSIFIYQFEACTERTDIGWICFFTRTSVNDLVIPHSEFMLDVFKLSVLDFLQNRELWVCAHNSGEYTLLSNQTNVKDRQPSQNLQKMYTLIVKLCSDSFSKYFSTIYYYFYINLLLVSMIRGEKLSAKPCILFETTSHSLRNTRLRSLVGP